MKLLRHFLKSLSRPNDQFLLFLNGKGEGLFKFCWKKVWRIAWLRFQKPTVKVFQMRYSRRRLREDLNSRKAGEKEKSLCGLHRFR
jgi:hypothetical protein